MAETFNVTIGANMDVGGVLNGVKQMQNAFNGLKLPANITANMTKDFDKLKESLVKFKALSEKDSFNKTDIKNLNKLQTEIDSLFDKLSSSFDEISGKKIYLEADASQIKQVQGEIDKLKSDIETKLSGIKIDFSSAKGGAASLGLDEMISGFERGVKSSKVLSRAMEEVKQSLQLGNFGDASNQLTTIINKAGELKGASTGLLSFFNQIGLIKLDKPAADLAKTKEGAEQLKAALQLILPMFEQDSEAVKQMATELDNLGSKKAELEKLAQSNIEKIMSEGAAATRGLGSAMKETGASAVGLAEASKRTADEVKQLQQSTQYFFGLRNMINLLKRGLREAVSTIKELDAAMTKTAVVTKFSIGDMWAKLPEYTANADALGASVKDMYEATTLYYQQGLNAQQAMGIATETMKMARIGGLEAADATDKMTAALRGFNMELNETSAQRVNDVYSNLAAKTASDTEELGTAMQRTASIAASAGMSFEGTAAFLAQAIETTREPAENLGTAMKTIVARFTELKKNPLEITEVDGEEVSYNKIDTALQSIGVSLKDANGQFRNLDKVFLDISQRWDSLTQTQQRYIATTAAGSRQQSRFIAMMSNYERTTQLMEYANNANGASAKQFGKTLDSLEAKINKFQNAWKGFLMNIMNDKATKFVVSAATKVLDVINKITNVLSGNGKFGLVQSVLSLGTAFMALRGVGGLINGGIGKLGGMLDPTTKRGALNLNNDSNAKGVAGRIVNPIVAKLNELIAVTKGTKTLNKTATSTTAEYKSAVDSLRAPVSMDAVKSTLNGLSDEHAYAAYINSPGTASAMKRSAMGWLNGQQLSPDMKKTGEQLMASIFKGMQKKQIPIKKGADLIGKPQLWGKYLGTETAQSFSDNFIKAQKAQREMQTASARQQAWWAAGQDRTLNDEEIKAALASKDTDDTVKQQVKDYYKLIRQQQKAGETPSFSKTVINPKQYEQLANQVGMVGSKFTAAGYSMQMFGAQLGQLSPALAGVGNLISRLGIFASTSGMAISGLGNVVSKVGARLNAGIEAMHAAQTARAASNGMSLLASGGTAGGAFLQGFTKGISKPLIGAAIAAAVIGGILLIKNHIEKKAKEAGEEVRKNFEEGFTKTNEKIESLEDKKGRFNELAKGVDDFGHNINLTTEEFDEYVSLSREMKDLSPSLIAGYNAEGEAILRKGAAIDEVIDKLKKEKQEALNTFTSDESIDKLLKAYKYSDTGKKHKTRSIRKNGEKEKSTTFGADLVKLGSIQGKANLSFTLQDAIRDLGLGDVSGISQLTTQQLIGVKDHYTDIINKIKEENKNLDDEVVQDFEESFSNIGSQIEDIMTEGQPIVDAMQQWMGAENLDAVGINLGEEFVNSFNQGFQGIMLEGLTEGWSSGEFKTTLRDYSDEWKKLTGDTSEYSKILEEANEIQKEYIDNIGTQDAVDNYNDSIADSVNKLKDLAAATDDSTAAGQAFKEQCIQQANALENYTTQNVESLSEALNTATDDIEAAESALENFNKATEKDYWTAAEDMRSIYDKAFETFEDSYGNKREKHFEGGKGDQTAWEAGKYILGEEAVKNIPDGKTLRKKLKEWEPALREGEEGWYNFWHKIVDDKDLLKGLNEIDGVTWDEDDFYIPEDKWAKVAETIGISEEMLTAMLNKGRQFADIDFSNWGLVRKNLETSENTLKGTATQDNGQNNIYVRKETFEQGLSEAGYRPEQYKAQEDKAKEKQNINLIDLESSAKTLKKQFDDMGLKTMPDFVTAMIKTGDWTKDEIQQLAQKAGIEGYNADSYSGLYDDLASAIDNPELHKQTAELEHISSQINTLINGQDSEAALEAAETGHKELVGEKGVVDTDAQAFAHGEKLIRDEDNNIVGRKKLTAAEYEATKASMEDSLKATKENAASAYDRMMHTTGEERDRWSDTYDKLMADAKIMEDFIAAGEKNFNEDEKDRNNRSSAQKKAQDNAVKKSKDAVNPKEAAQKKAQDDAVKDSDKPKEEKKEKSSDEAKKEKKDLADKNKEREEERQRAALQPMRDRENAMLRWNQKEQERLRKQQEERKQRETDQYEQKTQPTIEKTKRIEDDLSQRRSAAIAQQQEQSLVNAEKAQTKLNQLKEKEDKMNSSTPLKAGEWQRFNAIAKRNAAKDAESSDSLWEAYKKTPKAALAMDTLPAQKEFAQSLLNAVKNKFGQSGDSTNQKASTQTTTKNVENEQEKGKKLTQYYKTKFESEGAEEVKKEEDTIKEKADKGAEHTTTFKTETVGGVEKKLSNMEKKGKQTINAETKVDTKAADSAIQKFKSANPKIPIDADMRKATSTVNKWINGIKTRHVKIAVDVSTSGTHNLSFTVKKAAKGMNNYIPYAPLPSFGSLAKGTKSRYGQVGPRGKGGLTLTGEKGYEIAWLPDENRSMILGADGPQMLNLPRNAVVWTHEQSKKIVKQKAIPAGSHSAEAGGHYDSSSSIYASYNAGSTSAKIVKNAKDAGNKVAKTAEDVGKSIARVIVWWENAARRATDLQRKMDNNQSAYEKFLKEIQATLKTTGTIGKGNDFIASAGKYIAEQQRELVRANKELNTLEGGKAAKTQKSRKKQYARGKDNIAQISYKKGKKDKIEYVNLAKYITKNKDGSYQVSQKALNGIKNRERRQAIADAANKELNDRISKRNAAEDAIKKAQEALEKFGQELYETFFSWEIELTKIWNITTKIEEAQGRISQSDAYKDLLEAQLGSGQREAGADTRDEAIENFRMRLQNQENILSERQKAITENKDNLSRLLIGEDEKETLKNVNAKLSGTLSDTDRLAYEEYKKELEQQIKVASEARKFMTVNPRADGTVSVDFDTDKFQAAKEAGDYTGDMGKAIQDYVKEVIEQSKNLQENYTELTNSVTEFYSTLKDLRKQYSEYGEQLVNISEQAEKKKLENLKKLSDSVKKALDELLKKVKNTLDERRKQEDNVKTEKDISQKQQRLAALRADTAGGHQVEIAQLEKEIADAQQNYQRSLEDQLLDKLQQQADLAAEQRERQIQLQETIASSVNNIALVNMWMRNPEKYKEQIKQAYLEANDYDNKIDATKIVIEDEFEELYNGLISNQRQQKDLTTTIDKTKTILEFIYKQLGGSNLDLKTAKTEGMDLKTAQEVFTQASLKDFKDAGYDVADFASAQIAYNDAKSTFGRDALLANDFYKKQAEDEIAAEQEKAAKEAAKEKARQEYNKFLTDRGSKKKTKDKNWGQIGKVGLKAQINRGKQIGKTEMQVLQDLANTDALTWSQVLTAYIKLVGRKKAGDTVKAYFGPSPSAGRKAGWLGAFNKPYPQYYATGGLADYTGPAWLDGTPSKPELVLNAQDTKNFVALKDVLSHVMNSTDSYSGYGNITYAININVDKIEKDYDVDRVVEKVKYEIVKSSGYRNVTQVRNLR